MRKKEKNDGNGNKKQKLIIISQNLNFCSTMSHISN